MTRLRITFVKLPYADVGAYYLHRRWTLWPFWCVVCWSTDFEVVRREFEKRLEKDGGYTHRKILEA